MKKMIVALLLACTAIPVPAFAANKQKPAVQETKKENIIHVGVDGMVCDFCAQSLKKVFMKEPGVRQVDISLEKKLVTLGMKPGTEISDAKIKELVDWAGYKVSGIHRM